MLFIRLVLVLILGLQFCAAAFGACDQDLTQPVTTRSVGQPRFWTGDKVVAAVKALHAHGVAVHNKGMQKPTTEEEKDWIEAAIGRRVTKGSLLLQWRANRWGTWDDCLKAAGIDPETVKGQGAFWTKELIIAAIQRLVAGGEAVNSGAMQKPTSEFAKDLIEDATGHRTTKLAIIRAWEGNGWGSWDEALKAAGLDPRSIRQSRDYWTRDLVIAAIKALRRARKAVNAGAMIEEGSEKEKDIIEQATGHRTSKRAVALAWYNHGWGTWDDALRAAGLRVNTIRRYVVRPEISKDRVIEILKYLNESRVDIYEWSKLYKNSRYIRRLVSARFGISISGPALYFACLTHFESYKDAKSAAGVRRLLTVDPRDIPDWVEQVEFEDGTNGTIYANRAVGPRIETPEEIVAREEETLNLYTTIDSQSDRDQKILRQILLYLEDHDGLGSLSRLALKISAELSFEVTSAELQQIFETLSAQLE